MKSFTNQPFYQLLALVVRCSDAGKFALWKRLNALANPTAKQCHDYASGTRLQTNAEANEDALPPAESRTVSRCTPSRSGQPDDC